MPRLNYEITVEPRGGPASLEIVIAQPTIHIEALGDVRTPIIARLSRADWDLPFPLELRVTDPETGRSQSVEIKFRGP